MELLANRLNLQAGKSLVTCKGEGNLRQPPVLIFAVLAPYVAEQLCCGGCASAVNSK
jgi:hypothetical protein